MFCPKCGKENPDDSIFCRVCGKQIQAAQEEKKEEELKCPTFPTDLSIGKQVINWHGDSFVTGEFDPTKNVINNIPKGKLFLYLHEKGIKINNVSFSPFKMELHASQIINIFEKRESELVEINKSVIGRAVVGGLIFGPLGAIIGGMSGIGKKDKNVDNTFLILSYWDILTKKPLSLLITVSNNVKPFIKRVENELLLLRN